MSVTAVTFRLPQYTAHLKYARKCREIESMALPSFIFCCKLKMAVNEMEVAYICNPILNCYQVLSVLTIGRRISKFLSVLENRIAVRRPLHCYRND
jgi:hypothetical protein